MDAADPDATALQLATLLAPCSAGWQISMVLYGLYLMLAGQYLRSSMCRRAILPVRITLWSVSILLTAYQGLTFAQQISWTINTNRSLTYILKGANFESVPPVLAGTVAAPVQALLTVRTATLIRKRSIRYAFCSTVAGGIIAGFVFAVFACVTSLNQNFANHSDSSTMLDFNTCLAVWLALSAFVDVLISIALALTLKQRVAGFNEKTDALLVRLIRNGLQTAAYTAILAVVGASLALAYRNNNIRFTYLAYAFWTPLPACYGLSLYTTLSTRRTVEEYIGSSIPLPGSAQHNLDTTDRPAGRAISPLPPLGRRDRLDEQMALHVRMQGGGGEWSGETGRFSGRGEGEAEKSVV